MEVLDLVCVMKDQAKRIQALMDADKLNQQDVADKIGRHFSLISKYLNPKTKISRSFLLTLQDKLGWSADWIDTGRGPWKLRNGGNHPRKLELSSFNNITELTTNESEVKILGISGFDAYQNVKFVKYNVWASFSQNFDEFDFNNISDTYPVYLPGLDGPITDDHCVFEIVGDSMNPTIVERAKVLAQLLDNSNIDYIISGVYIIAYRKCLVIKRVIDNSLMIDGTLTLHSDNPISGKTVVKRDDIRFVWQVTDQIGGKIR